MPPLTLGLGFARGPVTASAPSLVLDSLSAGAAYSTRKLRTAYAGSAIRVRRSSDNTEQDIGFSGNALDTTALTSFVGANSGFVVTWYDQSGNARHITQATQANQPRIVNAGTIDVQNSVPSLFFNGTSHHLSNSSAFMYAAGAATMMLVAAGASQLDRRPLSEGSSTNGNPIYSLNTGSQTGTSLGVFARNDASVLVANPGDAMALQTGVWDGTLKAVAVRDTGAALDGFRNGTVGTQRSYTRADPTTFDRFAVGALVRNTVGSWFGGSISEVIIFPSAISNTDFNAVGASQGAAYGITVNPI